MASDIPLSSKRLGLQEEHSTQACRVQTERFPHAAGACKGRLERGKGKLSGHVSAPGSMRSARLSTTFTTTM